MRTFLKIILWVIGAVVALALLATLAMRIFFPAAKVKKMVEEQVRKQANREARLGGAVVGFRSISLTGFELSNVPNFAAGRLLSVETLEVQWELWPLMSRQIHLTKILLKKPQVNIIRMP